MGLIKSLGLHLPKLLPRNIFAQSEQLVVVVNVSSSAITFSIPYVYNLNTVYSISCYDIVITYSMFILICL